MVRNMTIRVIREPTINGTTHGVLFVNGHFQCHTLEDEIRAEKVPGQTAIPAGTYMLTLTLSRRFGMMLPEILDVPNFTGVRIHAGNMITDTEGCLLVGQDRQPGRLLRSRAALDVLLDQLRQAKDALLITIENPAV